MSTADVQLAQRFFDEMCNGRNLALADQLFSPEHSYHDPGSPGVAAGPRGMKELIGTYQRAVEDARWTVDAMFRHGELIVTRWTGSGTHTGDLFGIRPTGKKVSVDGIWIHRVAGGQIVESWNCWDTLGMLQQLGAVPPFGMKNAA
jgi:predicted ester cyclase